MPFTGRTGKTQRLREQLAGFRMDLYRLAYSWCHNPTLAEDLAQEAITRGIAKLEQLRNPEDLKPWLLRILVNAWRDHLRRQRPTDDIDDYVLTDSTTPEQLSIRHNMKQRVRDAIATLPQGQRIVISLVDLQEASYAEVATILDIPIGTVMSRLCRARRALSKVLMESDINPSVTRLHTKRSES
jgi:RNA polymerase sigma-70 factor (ECF subfamily)